MSRHKGVVLAIDGKTAIVLLDNGEYRKMSADGTLLIGREVWIGSSSLGKYAAAAAVFLLVLVASIDFFNVAAYARLSSGIEVGMNRWERVVYVKPLSPEGQDALEGIETKGRKVEDVVAAVVDAAVKQDTSAGAVTITVDPASNMGSDKDKELVKKISRAIIDNNPDNLTVIKKGNHLTIKGRPDKPDKAEHPSFNNDFDKSSSGPDKVNKNNNPKGNNGKQDPESYDIQDKLDKPSSHWDRQKDKESDGKITDDRYQDNRGRSDKSGSQYNKDSNNDKNSNKNSNKNNINNKNNKFVPDRFKER